MQLPFLGETSGAIALVLLGLTVGSPAGWLAVVSRGQTLFHTGRLSLAV